MAQESQLHAAAHLDPSLGLAPEQFEFVTRQASVLEGYVVSQ
jgi:hypothetical protein